MSRFDWYSATVRQPVGLVLETLSKLGDSTSPADGLARQYRYQQGVDVFHDSKGKVATILWGGHNDPEGERPHILASSDATDAFVEVVRTEWPDCHTVTRMDAAHDFNEPNCYDRLRPILRDVAKEHRVGFKQIADELKADAGRTQYMGSEKSDYRVRCYEKGYQVSQHLAEVIAKQHPGTKFGPFKVVVNEVTGECIHPENWTRIEVQVRPPTKEARILAAKASPEQAWTFSPWTAEVAKRTMALDLERMYIRTKKTSKDENALAFMCGQYGGILSRQADKLGGWEALGLHLQKVIATG